VKRIKGKEVWGENFKVGKLSSWCYRRAGGGGPFVPKGRSKTTPGGPYEKRELTKHATRNGNWKPKVLSLIWAKRVIFGKLENGLKTKTSRESSGGEEKRVVVSGSVPIRGRETTTTERVWGPKRRGLSKNNGAAWM